MLGWSLLPPALSLAVGIGAAAALRYRQQDIDGAPPAPVTPLDLALRYIRNTTEQLVLFLCAIVIAMALVPDLATRVSIPLGIWFGLMRALFWIGYRRGPVLRAVGFAGTFHPTLLLLIGAPPLALFR